MLPEPVQEELQAAVKWTLTREENAADTIQKLSYRLPPESELAAKARSYAAALKYYIARVKCLLPSDHSWADDVFSHDALTEAVIQSLDAKKATSVLIRFLLQHAETASDTMMFASDKLNANAVHRLWRKADKKRAKIVAWLENQESLHLTDIEADDAETSSSESAHTSPNAIPLNDASDRGEIQDAGRISYNPPQVVIWM